MTIKLLKLCIQYFVCIACLLMCSFTAVGKNEKPMNEKEIKLAMRMIGHETLLSLGDSVSRVLPIEKIDDKQFRIPFDSEFGFEPGNLISVVNKVLVKTQFSEYCMVEVESCEPKAIVHAFAVGQTMDENMLACGTRTLPSDCYALLVTLSEDEVLLENKAQLGSFTEKHGVGLILVCLIPLFFLGGIINDHFTRKKKGKTDPNSRTLGQSSFNTKKMQLTFQNKTTDLSHKESELLILLLDHANTTLEREVILQKVWGDEGDYIGRTLDVFISKLRKKLEADTSVKINSVRGVGYKLVTGL